MIKKFLDLGLQPLANKYLTKKDLVKKKVEYYYHLEIGFNLTSKLVSILNTVPPKKMFDKKFMRPAEVDTLLADYTKAKKILKWEPKITFDNLVIGMVENDLQHIKE